MYYDPQCKPETLLDRWIGWLGTKPASERYEWRDIGHCACGQFYGSGAWIKESGWSLLNKIARGEQRDDAYSRFDDPNVWTFGQCLERAKSFREQQHLGWLAR
jgi:hypothetical protein